MKYIENDLNKEIEISEHYHLKIQKIIEFLKT